MSIGYPSSTAEPVTAAVRTLATDWHSSHQLLPDAGWWHFDPVGDIPLRRQGWKLHVSAAPRTAVQTLRQVAEVLMPLGVRWKVARSLAQLMQLSGPPTPLSQVGKFITVYLDEDRQLGQLAERLHLATRGLDGPVVPSDRRYRRDSNVYLRYGAFSARASYAGADQAREYFIADSDGRRVIDRRAPGRYRPSWVPEPSLPPTGSRRRPGNGLFGRDIEVGRVLRQSAKGGVYQGRWRDRDVVIKEGRHGTCPDLLGRDSVTRLYNEWCILRHLDGSGLAPTPCDFFIEQGNAYLVMEFLAGETLRRFVEQLNYLGQADPERLRAACAAVAELASRLTDAGVQPRDFTPNNIMIEHDRYRVIDLELWQLAKSPEPPFTGWTPGYARPRPGRTPDAGDTEYATAAISHFILTGTDPFLGHEVPVAPHVEELLAAFGPSDPAPVADALSLVHTQLGDSTAARGSDSEPMDPDQIKQDAVAAGLELVRRTEWDSRDWPWPAAWTSELFHPACFHTGAGGVVRYYLDLWQATGDRDWLRHADSLLDWIGQSFPYLAGSTPSGLHFGLGALPWLMADLAAASSPDRAPRLWDRAGALAAELIVADPGSWDITHGWAGIGLMQLGIELAAERAGRRPVAGVATELAYRVLDHASDRDGLLVWPKGQDCSYGFAHGSAGIGYFLLQAGLSAGDPVLIEAAVGMAHALVSVAEPAAGGVGLTWRHGPSNSGVPWTHWCNGAAGVGGFLLAAGIATGEEALTEAARRAGLAITRGRAYGSSCRCHGLAGDGDYLLALAEAGQGEEFLAGARRIDRKLAALRIWSGFAWKWPHEGGGEPRPSYMRGYLGVHAFRLRLAGLLTGSALSISAMSGGSSDSR